MATAIDPEGLLDPVEREELIQDPEGLLEPQEAQIEPQEQAGRSIDPEGLLEPEGERPSRLGAVARTVASEFLPTTAAGVAGRAGFAATPGPLPVKLLGALGLGGAAYLGAKKGQEALIGATLGPERLARIEQVLQKDIETYPVSTTAASILTPTVGGVAAIGGRGLSAIGRGIRGIVGKEIPKTAETVSQRISEDITEKAGEIVKKETPDLIQEELPLPKEEAIKPTPKTERLKLLPEPKEGEGIRSPAEKLVVDPRISDELAKKIAKERSLYNKLSPQSVAEDLKKLTPEARAVIREGNDTVAATAKVVDAMDAWGKNDVNLADSLLGSFFEKGTNAGQLLNVFKLLYKTPEGYAFLIEKTLEKAQRKLATKAEEKLAEAGAKFTPALKREAMDLYAKKVKADDDFNKAAELARKELSVGAEKRAIAAEKVKLKSSQELATFEADLLAKKLGEQFPDYIRGNLLTSQSQVANIIGNTVNQPLNMASRFGGYFFELLERSVFSPIIKKVGLEKFIPTLTKQEIASPLGGIERTIETAKGGARGLKGGIYGLRYGATPGGFMEGEGIRGFRPASALKRFFTGKGMATPVGRGAELAARKTMDKVRLLSEGVLGIAPETFFRLLQLGDSAPRGGAIARLLTEQAQLNKLKGRKLQMAVRFPTELEMSKVSEEASRAIYQQDTFLSRAVQRLLAGGWVEKVPQKAIQGVLRGVTRTATTPLVPYVKTPLNVIDELVEYSVPEYAFTKALYNRANGNFRRANILFAKSVIGYAMSNVAQMLARSGVITSEIGKSEKIKDIQFQAEPPSNLNLDALKRYIDSDGAAQETQPGDYVIKLEKLGAVGAILHTRMAAMQAKDGGSDSLGEAWGSAIPETLSFGFNQSFLRGMNGMMNAMSGGDADKMDAWLTNYYSALTASVIPNSLATYSRYVANEMPDKIRVKDIEGEGSQRTINIFKEVVRRKFPKEAGELPSRINVWGQRIPQTPEGVDPIIFNFIDPSKGRRVTYDNITMAVYDLYKKTGNSDGIPPVPDRDMQIKDARTGKTLTYRLDPFVYEDYAITVGKANRAAAERLLDDRNFRKLDAEKQVKMLGNAYDKATEEIRNEFRLKNRRKIELGRRK